MSIGKAGEYENLKWEVWDIGRQKNKLEERATELNDRLYEENKRLEQINGQIKSFDDKIEQFRDMYHELNNDEKERAKVDESALFKEFEEDK